MAKAVDLRSDHPNGDGGEYLAYRGARSKHERPSSNSRVSWPDCRLRRGRL